MGLPELSHLQYLALDLLNKGALEGQELQAALAREGQKQRTGPAFYMFTKRLVEAGYVESAKESRERETGPGATQILVYKLTSVGRRARRAAQAFYKKERK